MTALLVVLPVVVIQVDVKSLHPSTRHYHGRDFDDIANHWRVCTFCCSLVQDIPTILAISHMVTLCSCTSWLKFARSVLSLG